ncbi:NADH dehydrogenase (ubiquinone) Fe-S protein 5 [Nesidiocoris tenuis]|uniref:NADH dehydrogenase (Ubiquinone) Fe-S protein 5 n=1 Tax=Nesidiocoris tenuis TaxID=355587 RepID=A0ABN7AG69_9HEMI|nr:NADH dehydrogenase (ubiquinone) Fe-S protein 5 [Nesidiocoris tenuis]
MPITAYIRNPLTDLTGMMLTNQFMSPCSRLEEKTVNCYEAYGADKGSVNCKDLVEDLYECVTRTKERARALEMIFERERQVKNGQIQYADGPKHDAYQPPLSPL